MLLLSNDEKLETETILEGCSSVLGHADQEVLIIPSDDLCLLMDLSGKLYVEPKVFVLDKAKTLYLSEGTTLLFMKLPGLITINTFIEVSEGEYEIDDDWVLAVYGEMLNELHENKRLSGNNTHSILNWANYHAHKGYTEILQEYVAKLKIHISQERIDSRSMRRRFNKTFGRSPLDVKLINRFNKSLKQFMDIGQFPIEEYSDQSHWIRECKKYTGLTPTELRTKEITYCFLTDLFNT
jgi:AraC-like DNA-binding protein